MSGRVAPLRRALLAARGGLAIARRLAAQPAERLRIVGYLSGDRPVFTLNRRSARAIGVAIPPPVLLRATEVID